MNDREWLYLTGAIIALAVLWYAATHRGVPVGSAPSEVSGALPVGWQDPMLNVYNANPNAYLPPNNLDLTVQVANQLPSLLADKYMPLFGFVGIAQGAMFA